MSDTRKIKIENFLESQIPSFLTSDSPLFKDFLTQYYISQTHSTGTLDFANNLTDYKNIATFASEKLYTTYDKNKCILINEVLAFDDEIKVNSTVGFPDKYGLIQIDNEIITYTGITTNSFTGCVRGFSGVSDINDTEDITGLVFSVTFSEEHLKKSTVKNLNTIFYKKIFEKFKSQYLPDFENREFSPNVDLDLILSRARDFYLTKGTDISFKILFEILYNDPIEVLKPQEYIIRSSDNQLLITKNILVELVMGEFKPLDLIGSTIIQQLPNGTTASAAIYNIEYRPTDDYDLYEISLDSESIVYDFTSTKQTTVLEKLSNELIVDSTIGFTLNGRLYCRVKNLDRTYSIKNFNYEGKTINKFLNITGISSNSYETIKVGDQIIEDNLLEIMSDKISLIRFRLINVIENFDFSNTNTIDINDKIYLTSFGENISERVEFTSWLYNYPTYHNIKFVDNNDITLYDSIRFIIGEEIEVYDVNTGISTTKVLEILNSNKIRVEINTLNNKPKVKIKKKITKSSLNPNECVNIQNTYLNQTNDNLIVAASGLPPYPKSNDFNNYTFSLTGIGTIFNSFIIDNNASPPSRKVISHNLLSGNKINITSNNSELKTQEYYIKKINSNSLSLYKSSGDLYLSYAGSKNLSTYSSPVNIKTTSPDNIVGVATVLGYQNSVNVFANQLLLKEFNIPLSHYRNKAESSTQIYTIEDAYTTFKNRAV